MFTAQIQKQAEQFESTAPFEILSWASETFGDRLAVVTSFQATGIVTLHMMQRIAPRTPVLTLDTGLLFPETYELMGELETRFDLNLRRINPRQTPAQQARDYGDRLWERNPDRCCHIRKTIPLRDAWSASMPGSLDCAAINQRAAQIHRSSAATLAIARSRLHPSPTGPRMRSGAICATMICPTIGCTISAIQASAAGRAQERPTKTITCAVDAGRSMAKPSAEYMFRCRSLYRAMSESKLMTGYPIMLHLQDKPVAVVGGGGVAARKVSEALERRRPCHSDQSGGFVVRTRLC